MPLHPEAQQLLDMSAAAGLPPLWEMTPEQARNSRPLPPPGPEVHRVEDMEVAGPEGPIPVRLYWPREAESLPVLVWYHGGGWVLGNLDTVDPTMRHLCNAADCIVISVDYRLAPEHPWPAAADDAYAATVWAAQNAPRYGGDASRIAVGGDSAGGNLATVVAMMVRDRGGPPLTHQVLVYPVIDAAMDTVSYRENTAYLLHPRAMGWFWDLYCPEGIDRTQPYVSPCCATDLSGLPPAHVITAEFDPLRDEGEAYGRQLEAAGVPVHLERYDGQMHGFFNTPHALEDARRAIESAGAELRRAFGESP